jgi:lipopolysaccharide biosynthesis glycosyltransferase
MKYIYVLTSSNDDYYYEQFLLSIVSLRFYNPHAHISVLIDSMTKENLINVRTEYEKIVSNIIIVNAPSKLSQKGISRWIKTSVKNYIDGDFLYIDCDTIITSNLNNNFPQEIKIGAILDTHVELSKHHLKHHFEHEDLKLNFNSSFELGMRYNGGVIFCRDSPETTEFYSNWHSLWEYSYNHGNHHDMPSLNQVNYKMNKIITELDGIWNCQITHNGLPFLYNAKIIHYYATAFNFINSPFLLASNDILSQIKQTGTIPGKASSLIENPKTAFEPDSRIVSGEAELDVINSKFFSVLLRLRKKKPDFFKAFNNFIIYILSRIRT